MANTKGRILYVPPALLDELGDIKREDEVESNSEAFKKLVKYARVGREAKRLIRFDWTKSKPRVPVEGFPFEIPKNGKKKKYKKNKNVQSTRLF